MRDQKEAMSQKNPYNMKYCMNFYLNMNKFICIAYTEGKYVLAKATSSSQTTYYCIFIVLPGY